MRLFEDKCTPILNANSVFYEQAPTTDTSPPDACEHVDSWGSECEPVLGLEDGQVPATNGYDCELGYQNANDEFNSGIRDIKWKRISSNLQPQSHPTEEMAEDSNCESTDVSAVNGGADQIQNILFGQTSPQSLSTQANIGDHNASPPSRCSGNAPSAENPVHTGRSVPGQFLLCTDIECSVQIGRATPDPLSDCYNDNDKVR